MNQVARFCVKFHMSTILNWIALIAAVGALWLTVALKDIRLVSVSIVALIPWIKTLYTPTLERQLDELNKENGQLRPLKDNLEKIFGVWLDQVLDMMGLDKTWRASFYIYDERNAGSDLFRFVSRKSDDPTLEAKGRLEFPASEGVIGISWKRGSFASYYATSKSIESRNQYAGEMLRNFNMNYDTAIRLTMMAACIMSHVICDVDGRKKGVLVIESSKCVKLGRRDALEAKCKKVVLDVEKYLSKLGAITADYVLCQEELVEAD